MIKIYVVILSKKIIAKEFIQKEATLKLKTTDRQVRRIIIKYKNSGEKAFVRKIYNKPSHKKKSQMKYQMRL